MYVVHVNIGLCCTALWHAGAASSTAPGKEAGGGAKQVAGRQQQPPIVMQQVDHQHHSSTAGHVQPRGPIMVRCFALAQEHPALSPVVVSSAVRCRLSSTVTSPTFSYLPSDFNLPQVLLSHCAPSHHLYPFEIQLLAAGLGHAKHALEDVHSMIVLHILLCSA